MIDNDLTPEEYAILGKLAYKHLALQVDREVALILEKPDFIIPMPCDPTLSESD